MTYVTCPTLRYHPAIVAQKAATMQILSGNRFRLGLGAGENLNEHVVGKRWPAVGVRHEMLSEAVDIIAALFDGDGRVNYRGRHFDVEQAKLWDLPDERVPIGHRGLGRELVPAGRGQGGSDDRVEPKPELGEMFDAAGGAGKPRVGQIALAYDPDRDAAVQRAHEQFRWFGLGWKVNADLPNPESFDGATQFVTPRSGRRAARLRSRRGRARREDQAVRRRRLRPRWRWCRSAPTSRNRSSTGPSASCCRRCGRCERAQRDGGDGGSGDLVRHRAGAGAAEARSCSG